MRHTVFAERFFMNITQLISDIFTELRNMDSESGYRLRDYQNCLKEAGHSKYCTRSVQDEVPITDMLANRLRGRYSFSEAEQRYVGGECDVVCGKDNDKLWLEAKVVYTLYYDGYQWRRATNINRKLNDLAHDWNEKLCRLTSENAAAIAALLIGFQTDEHPINDGHVTTRLQDCLGKPYQQVKDNWSALQPRWPNMKFRTKLWLWYRQLTLP
jgi:hypothetical protein